MGETLYIVMPAYNEAENIASVVKEWYPILDVASKDSKLIVADGGSKDNTLEILESLKKDYPRLEVFSKPGTDHGTKVIFLYDYAYRQGADWVFQTDSDGQTNPDEFMQFWNERSNYDVLLGNRIKRGDGFKRKVIEKVLCCYILVFFSVWVKDANVPFRLMRPAIVKKYLPLMPEVYNMPNAVLVACFARFKDRMFYKEISFQPRRGGRNFMSIKKIFKLGWESVKTFWDIRKKMEDYERSLA